MCPPPVPRKEQNDDLLHHFVTQHSLLSVSNCQLLLFAFEMAILEIIPKKTQQKEHC